MEYLITRDFLLDEPLFLSKKGKKEKKQSEDNKHIGSLIKLSGWSDSKKDTELIMLQCIFCPRFGRFFVNYFC